MAWCYAPTCCGRREKDRFRCWFIGRLMGRRTNLGTTPPSFMPSTEDMQLSFRTCVVDTILLVTSCRTNRKAKTDTTPSSGQRNSLGPMDQSAHSVSPIPEPFNG